MAVQRSVMDYMASGIPVHIEVAVSRKDIDGEHIQTVVRDTDKGDQHIHEEVTITDTTDGSLHRVVSHITTTAPEGKTVETRVATDKEDGDESIHTEMVEKEGPEGCVRQEETTISSSSGRVTTIERFVDGKRIYQEVTDRCVNGENVHEDFRVEDREEKDEYVHRIVHDTTRGYTRVHKDSTITEWKTGSYRKEVSETTKASLKGVTHVTRVITDKEEDGEHVRTEMVEKEGPRGSSSKELTEIWKDDEALLAIDKVVGGKRIHQEACDKRVKGVDMHENLTVVDKDEHGEHVHQVLHETKKGDELMREESRITDRTADGFHKEVSNTTKASLKGVVHITRVTTDKDENNEHIHTEMIDKEGPRGHTCEEVTEITKGNECTVVVDKYLNGKKIHQEVYDLEGLHEDLTVIDKNVCGERQHKSLREVRKGGELVRQDSFITERETDNFRKEVSTTTKASLKGVTHTTRVITDKDENGEHIHTEMIDKEGPHGHSCEEVAQITTDRECVSVVDKFANGKRIHQETSDKENKHEHLTVIEKEKDGERTCRVVHDKKEGDVLLRQESFITDRNEDRFHKEVSNTTKASLKGVVHVTRVVTDKDENGERIHTEMVDKEGPHGHSCEELTEITKDGEVTSIVDRTVNGKQIHQEVHEMGDLHDDLLVIEKEECGEHIRKVLHETKKGCELYRQESLITDKDHYHKEVSNSTKASFKGVFHVTRVVTDKEEDGEHVHTEMVDKEGPRGHSCEEVTEITKAGEATTVVDRYVNGKKIHQEAFDSSDMHEDLVVVDRDEGDEHLHKVLHEVKKGDELMRQESFISDRKADHFRKEVSNTTKASLKGVSHVTRVITDKDENGEHIHTEMMDKEGPHGHSCEEVTEITTEGQETVVVDRYVNGKKIHQEVCDKGPDDHEDLTVIDADENGERVHKVLHETVHGSDLVRQESFTTDRREDHYHKEVSNVTKASAKGVTHVTRVITDKDENGEHIHTEMVDKEGPHGHSCEEVTEITTNTESTTIVDKFVNGKKIHQEVYDKEVEGEEEHEDLTVYDNDDLDNDGDHVHRVIRDTDKKGEHVHQESYITDRKSDRYHKEVSNFTISGSKGDKSITRVVTDKFDNDNEELVHNEVIDTDGPEGHTCEDTTTITKDGNTTVIDNRIAGGRQAREVHC